MNVLRRRDQSNQLAKERWHAEWRTTKAFMKIKEKFFETGG